MKVFLFVTILSCIASTFIEKIGGLPLIYISFIAPIIPFLIRTHCFDFRFDLSTITKPSYLILFGLICSWLLTIFTTSYLFDSIKYIALMLAFTFISIQLRRSIVLANTSYLPPICDFFDYYSYHAKIIIVTGISSSILAIIFANTGYLNRSFVSLGTDPNMMSYILMFFLLTFYIVNSRVWQLLTVVLMISSGSRTAILLVFLFYLILSLRTFASSFSMLILPLKIFRRLIIASTLLTILFLVNPDFGRGKLTDSLYSGFISASKLIFNSDVVLNTDFERVQLKQANLLLLNDTWPIGIGSGLLNYKDKLSPYAQQVGVRSAKAHNFYLSYSVEFGFLILPILLGVSLKICSGLRSSKTYYNEISIFLVCCMSGLAFNEYFISPAIFLALFL